MESFLYDDFIKFLAKKKVLTDTVAMEARILESTLTFILIPIFWSNIVFDDKLVYEGFMPHQINTVVNPDSWALTVLNPIMRHSKDLHNFFPGVRLVVILKRLSSSEEAEKIAVYNVLSGLFTLTKREVIKPTYLNVWQDFLEVVEVEKFHSLLEFKKIRQKTELFIIGCSNVSARAVHHYCQPSFLYDYAAAFFIRLCEEEIAAIRLFSGAASEEDKKRFAHISASIRLRNNAIWSQVLVQVFRAVSDVPILTDILSWGQDPLSGSFLFPHALPMAYAFLNNTLKGGIVSRCLSPSSKDLLLFHLNHGVLKSRNRAQRLNRSPRHEAALEAIEVAERRLSPETLNETLKFKTAVFRNGHVKDNEKILPETVHGVVNALRRVKMSYSHYLETRGGRHSGVISWGSATRSGSGSGSGSAAATRSSSASSGSGTAPAFLYSLASTGTEAKAGLAYIDALKARLLLLAEGRKGMEARFHRLLSEIELFAGPSAEKLRLAERKESLKSGLAWTASEMNKLQTKLQERVPLSDPMFLFETTGLLMRMSKGLLARNSSFFDEEGVKKTLKFELGLGNGFKYTETNSDRVRGVSLSATYIRNGLNTMPFIHGIGFLYDPSKLNLVGSFATDAWTAKEACTFSEWDEKFGKHKRVCLPGRHESFSLTDYSKKFPTTGFYRQSLKTSVVTDSLGYSIDFPPGSLVGLAYKASTLPRLLTRKAVSGVSVDPGSEEYTEVMIELKPGFKPADAIIGIVISGEVVKRLGSYSTSFMDLEKILYKKCKRSIPFYVYDVFAEPVASLTPFKRQLFWDDDDEVYGSDDDFTTKICSIEVGPSEDASNVVEFCKREIKHAACDVLVVKAWPGFALSDEICSALIELGFHKKDARCSSVQYRLVAAPVAAPATAPATAPAAIFTRRTTRSALQKEVYTGCRFDAETDVCATATDYGDLDTVHCNFHGDKCTRKHSKK